MKREKFHCCLVTKEDCGFISKFLGDTGGGPFATAFKKGEEPFTITKEPLEVEDGTATVFEVRVAKAKDAKRIRTAIIKALSLKHKVQE